MKGGEKVNVGQTQTLIGSMPHGNVVKAEVVSSGSLFGTVLANISENGKALSAELRQGNVEGVSDDTISTIYNATSVEELIAELELVDVDVTELQSLQGLDEFSQLSKVDISHLVDSMKPILEQAGLSESEIMAVSNATDLMALLNELDDIAPKLFEEMSRALEGKGLIPKEQGLELLAYLKAVAIVAPNTDLTMQQEQQLFSLQGFLVSAGERFETTLNLNQNRNNVVQLPESRQFINFTMQSETQNDSLKDAPKEAVQQSINHTVLTTRSEAALTEVENRNNARHETLLREMQNIFKRANFGQTGGTNRLLIKLYPEHLGQVRIELLQTNGVLTARILASNALGKEMLDSQLHQLRSAFAQQNLQVERIDITQMLDESSKNDHQHGMFNQHFKKEQEDSRHTDDQNEEEVMTFQEYMIELEA